MLRTLLLFVGLAALLPAVTTAADTPRLLPFQARLSDATGQPLADGARVVQFQVFGEPTGGTPLWAGEVHRATVNGGLVNVMLGSKNPLPNDRADDPSRSFFDAALYLQVTPDLNADHKITEADPPLLPRQAIVPVLFAREAAISRAVAERGITAPMIADAAVGTAELQDHSVSAAKLQDAAVGLAQLAPGVTNTLAPPGSITAFAGLNPPAGWLLCDGSAVARAEYATLFSAIGTAWGQGNASTTFNIPDLRGYFLRGRDLGAGRDPDASSRTTILPGGNRGDNVGSVQTDSYKKHYHRMKWTDISVEQRNYIAQFNDSAQGWDQIGYEDLKTSEEGESETRPKNVSVNYIIKDDFGVTSSFLTIRPAGIQTCTPILSILRMRPQSIGPQTATPTHHVLGPGHRGDEHDAETILRADLASVVNDFEEGGI